MSVFVQVDHVNRVFDLPNGEQYIALKNIELKINKGEFITLLGHSGCGKSTLLNIIAGLDKASEGGIILEGREVREPGPDRMVVFQNYSLLPWLTVRENIALAVDEVYRKLPKTERKEIVEKHLKLVGLRQAADKRPGEISGGMKQRVAIARALSIRPQLLLLDEPFGALDALTRGGLQEQLMKICEANQVSAVMVTHDVDEALLLSDRIVMLTNGPEAHIGQILDVNIPRPRQRMEVVNHPSYYALRNEVVYFLNQQKKAKKSVTKKAPMVIAKNGLEKVNLDLGFIPLTDCAPLIIAKEKGIFEEYGLSEVTLSRETSWKLLGQGVVEGRLDAAQMVAGMPIAMTLGFGNNLPIPIVTAMTLSRNGNGITLSKNLYEHGVKTLEDFKIYIENNLDKVHTLGMVHPSSMHNLMLRYWLASGGINPDQDVNLTVIPPPQMQANLKAGNIDGYCVGGPWNARSVHEGLGFVIANSFDIFPNGHTDKVLGVKEEWANRYPKTHVALVKSLIDACDYCDDRRNREEILEILCRDEYIGSAPEYTRLGFIDPVDRGNGQPAELLINYNQFYVDKTNYPDATEFLWIMAEMARWGITPFPKNWVSILERVLRTDVYGQAARELGLSDTGRDRQSVKLLDGTIFNPNDPIKYLKNLKIKQEIRIEEIILDPIAA
ncbi:ABC transporter ATP-binding/substrate-binding protein [Planktothrix agardhii]|uniref:ABC transporter ATP-binding/substrate-binding protein n=1 Tax=Planktothrix agardhii TaxID=1160 RepID=UPI0020A836A0|nr:nitrate ABC transporter ATP-binding protein [Planktothrix agardhii]CAD5918553.1 Nitrate transport ATP-binding protein NrtC [Planktothrix agardhii]